MGYPLIPSSTDFQSVRDGILSLPLYFDVDLSIARSRAAGTAAIFEVAGNSLFQDQDVAGGGICKITFQHRDFGISDPAFTSAPGFQAAVPFTRLLIENAAQAGKTARIFYGVDLDFKPASVGVVQITGGVSIAQGGTITQANANTVSGAATMFLPANAARKRFIFRHGDATLDMMLGNSAVSASNSPIRLAPGDVWVETDSAAAEWWVFCAGVRTYNLQEAV